MQENLSFKSRLKRDMQYQMKLIKKSRKYYLFILPYFIIFAVFTVMPVIISIIFSFTSFNMLQQPKFIGFDNYFRLFFNDSVFMEYAFKNTMIFALTTGPIGYIMAFMFGWLVNELTHGMRVLFTIIFYAPSISGGIYVMWTYLFSGDAQGLVNSVMLRLGMTNSAIQFFTDEKYMVPLIILIMLWMSLGTMFLIFIAGFQGIDKQYYEAAAIDGINNRWQELWYITLPLLRPQLLLNAVLTITGSFGVGDQVTALCGFPSANYQAHTIMNHLTDYGSIRYEMGYACAIATVLFLLMIGCNVLIHKLLKKVGV